MTFDKISARKICTTSLFSGKLIWSQIIKSQGVTQKGASALQTATKKKSILAQNINIRSLSTINSSSDFSADWAATLPPMDSDKNTTSSMPHASGKLPEESVDSRMDDKNRKGNDGVQFRSQSSIAEIRRISRASNYDMEEIINYWGESDEHDMRKSELKEAVKDMYFNRRGSDSEFTTLGIDDKVGHGRAVKKVNRMLARNAVMDEQDLQNNEGIVDDEMLADVYSLTSTPAKREAQIKAQRLHDALKEEK